MYNKLHHKTIFREDLQQPVRKKERDCKRRNNSKMKKSNGDSSL